MDDGAKFITRILAGTFCFVILTIGACEMHTDYRISKAIESGVEPYEARLTFRNVVSDKLMIHRLTKILDAENSD